MNMQQPLECMYMIWSNNDYFSQYWLFFDHLQLVPHHLCGHNALWCKLHACTLCKTLGTYGSIVCHCVQSTVMPTDQLCSHKMFCYSCIPQTMMRIWDTFLYEGSKVLFRYAIAIFLYNQEDLLSEDNSISIFNKLRSMCKEATDVKRLTEVSWEALLSPLKLASTLFVFSRLPSMKSLDSQWIPFVRRGTTTTDWLR